MAAPTSASPKFRSINMSLQGVGRAYRRATMRVDPTDASRTIFEQEGGVVLHGDYPRQFKNSVEHFAAQAFLGVCRRATGESCVGFAGIDTGIFHWDLDICLSA